MKRIQESRDVDHQFGNRRFNIYVLRENPKKTRRVVDDSRFCKQCGKGFQSIKALSGHMACHSDRGRGFKDDHSSTTRYKKVFVKSSSFDLVNDVSHSGFDVDEQEQVNLAMCLMMLSRYSGNRGESCDRKVGVNHVLNGDETLTIKKFEDVKLNSDVLEDVIAEVENSINSDNSDSLYFLDKCTKTESQKRKYKFESPKFSNEAKNGSLNADEVCNSIKKRSKYECLNCRKSFDTYRALGGHRPCHRTSNAHFESSYDATYLRTIDKFGESSSINGKASAKSSSKCDEKRVKAMQNKGHVCPFYHRVFKNGQALGGRKRSHFIVKKTDVSGLLDLNLPASAEDKEYGLGKLMAS